MRPGKPYPAAFRKLKLRVDRTGIETFHRLCKSQSPPWNMPAHLFSSEVRPGIEPGLRPYHRRVLPQHLQTDCISDHGWNRTIGLLLVTQAS